MVVAGNRRKRASKPKGPTESSPKTVVTEQDKDHATKDEQSAVVDTDFSAKHNSVIPADLFVLDTKGDDVESEPTETSNGNTQAESDIDMESSVGEKEQAAKNCLAIFQASKPPQEDINEQGVTGIVITVGVNFDRKLRPSSQKKQRSKKQYAKKTVKSLEKQLFEPASSDDEFDFKFLPDKYCKSRKTSNETQKTTAPKQSQPTEEDNSCFFVVDGVNNIDDKPKHVAKDKKKTKTKDEILRRAKTKPTELHVTQVKTVFDDPNMVDSYRKKADLEIMKKAVLNGEFLQKNAVPPYKEGQKALARKRREEKASTKGSGWFDMRAPEMNDELQADLEALQLRGLSSSWTGYKKNDYKQGGPKFFQVATVQDSAIDFYHSRIPKKDRKRTLVDELLADAEFKKQNKKMYGKALEKLSTKHPNKKHRRTK